MKLDHVSESPMFCAKNLFACSLQFGSYLVPVSGCTLDMHAKSRIPTCIQRGHRIRINQKQNSTLQKTVYKMKN